MGSKREASEIQKLASTLTKMNTGRKVPLADVRQVLRDLVLLDATYNKENGFNGKGPVDVLITLSQKKSIPK
jgi:hypothetical protein